MGLGRAPKEDRYQGSSKERRAAAASGHRRNPSPRPRGGQGRSTQSSPRGRARRRRCRLRSLPPRLGLAARGGRVAGGRTHGNRGGRRATPRLRLVLLHSACCEAAGGVARGAWSRVRRSGMLGGHYGGSLCTIKGKNIRTSEAAPVKSGDRQPEQ